MSRPKRVAIYTDDPDEGGVAAYNHSVLTGLARAGYEAFAVQTESSSPMVQAQREAGVKHHWLGFHTRHDAVRNATNTEDARQAFEAIQPDVVLFANCSPFSHVAAKTVAVAKGIPFIVVEGYVAPYENLNPEVAWYLYHLEEHYKQARAVVAVSRENLDLLQRYYRLPKGKGEIIYYGRPSVFFDAPNPETRRKLRGELSVPDDAVLVLTVGRLEGVKGYQLQIEAIKHLKQSSVWPKLHFAWIGSGSLEEHLRNTLKELGVEDHVHLLGQRWDVPDWLAASDAFLLPSLYEGMPLVIMEAMARGLPVLASAVSGIPEELGDTGKLLPSPHDDAVGTVTEIVRTLEHWVQSPPERIETGRAGQRRASDLFREERMVYQVIQAVERAGLPKGDYVSPGFEIVRPDPCFPHLTVGNPEKASWKYLRRGLPHNWYIDARAPDTGFSNRDEAHILFNSARRFAGRRGLEIGCWLGWSLTHIALGGVEVDVIDPALGRPDFVENISHSLRCAGVLERVHFVPGFSPAEVVKLNRKWPFFFIDGNHDAPYPVFDAAICAEHAEADALILFHDLASPEVADGLEYLRQCGWNTMVYMTAQIMGVAWRGNARPVRHVPDPAVNWHLPQHLRHFHVCEMS